LKYYNVKQTFFLNILE